MGGSCAQQLQLVLSLWRAILVAIDVVLASLKLAYCATVQLDEAAFFHFAPCFCCQMHASASLLVSQPTCGGCACNQTVQVLHGTPSSLALAPVHCGQQLTAARTAAKLAKILQQL